MQLDKASSPSSVDQTTIPAAPAAAAAGTTAAAPITAARGRRPTLPTWIKLLIGNPLAATGLAVLALFILAAIFASFITT